MFVFEQENKCADNSSAGCMYFIKRLPYEHFCFFKGFVFKGLWPLLCYYTIALYRGFEEHLCKFHPFNPSETVGPKEAAKEDNSAPVFCIRKTCGRDRNSID